MADDTPQIDPEILQLLGLFVIRWSGLERYVADVFSALLTAGGAKQPIDPGALLIVTENVSAATMAGWTRTLAGIRQTPDDVETELRDMLREFDELRGDRNALVHGLWGTDARDPGSATVQTIRFERTPPLKDEVVTAHDLDTLIDDALRLQVRFVSFLRRHGLPHHQ